MASITYIDFEKVEIRSGRVVRAEPFPKAKKPAYRLWIDFGEFGLKQSSAQITSHYSCPDLIGRAVLAVTNFPPRQVADFISEVLVLGVVGPDNDVVLIKPDFEVPPGEPRIMTECETINAELKSLANPANVAGMARFGIKADNTLGVSMPVLREMAKPYRKNHELAAELWQSGIHEAHILASLIDDPRKVTVDQMEAWTADIDSWDVCDQLCSNLWEKTPYAYAKAVEWSRRDEEFVKRAGFVLMARSVVGGKKRLAPPQMAAIFAEIERGAVDDRNYVKKAVSWALRQIGKSSLELNRQVIATAEKIALIDAPSARWIAADAMRELKSDAVQKRLSARVK